MSYTGLGRGYHITQRVDTHTLSPFSRRNTQRKRNELRAQPPHNTHDRKRELAFETKFLFTCFAGWRRQRALLLWRKMRGVTHGDRVPPRRAESIGPQGARHATRHQLRVRSCQTSCLFVSTKQPDLPRVPPSAPRRANRCFTLKENEPLMTRH